MYFNNPQTIREGIAKTLDGIPYATLENYVKENKQDIQANAALFQDIMWLKTVLKNIIHKQGSFDYSRMSRGQTIDDLRCLSYVAGTAAYAEKNKQEYLEDAIKQGRTIPPTYAAMEDAQALFYALFDNNPNYAHIQEKIEQTRQRFNEQ